MQKNGFKRKEFDGFAGNPQKIKRKKGKGEMLEIKVGFLAEKNAMRCIGE